MRFLLSDLVLEWDLEVGQKENVDVESSDRLSFLVFDEGDEVAGVGFEVEVEVEVDEVTPPSLRRRRKGEKFRDDDDDGGDVDVAELDIDVEDTDFGGVVARADDFEGTFGGGEGFEGLEGRGGSGIRISVYSGSEYFGKVKGGSSDDCDGDVGWDIVSVCVCVWWCSVL